MQSEKLSKKESEIVKEAKAFLEDINKFKPELEKKTIVAMRRYAVENVDQVFEKVMREVNEENKDIIQFPFLNVNNDVWVYAAHFKELKRYGVSATKMLRESAWYIAIDFRKKGVIYIPVEDFKITIRGLITLIQDGKHDEHIRLTAEQLIYNKMLQRFDYIIRKMSSSINRPKYEEVPKDRKIPEYKAVTKDKKVPKYREIK